MQQGGAPSAAPVPGAVPSRAAGQALPEVPGFDMARVQRALTMPNNQYARQYLQAYMQAAQLLQRGEPSVETVADPDSPTGRRFVSRAEAIGRPAPGTSELPPALARIERLAPDIRSGRATPEQVRQYQSAVTEYQQTRIGPNDTVTPRLPPYAPGLDVLEQLYPGVNFTGPGQAAAAPGAAPAQMAQAAPAAAAPAAPASNPDVAPAAPNLPPAAPMNPGLPSAQGGRVVDPSAMQPGTRSTIEGQQFNAQETLASLQDIAQLWRPEFQQVAPRLSARWTAIRERAGANVSEEDRRALAEMSQARQAAMANVNQVIRAMSGAAVSVQEAERMMAVLPNPGTGIFDGDSPTEFRAKLDRSLTMIRHAIMRHNYALSPGRGLNPTQTGIELSDIPRLYERRAREIEAEVREQNRGMAAEEIRRQTRVRLRSEFGM